MAWIQTDVVFPTRGAVLTLSLRNVANFALADFLPVSSEGKPEELEKRFRSLLDQFRKELSGGVLIAIRLNLYRGEWEFLYEHPSLKAVPDGGEYERQPLIPIEA